MQKDLMKFLWSIATSASSSAVLSSVMHSGPEICCPVILNRLRKEKKSTQIKGPPAMENTGGPRIAGKFVPKILSAI